MCEESESAPLTLRQAAAALTALAELPGFGDLPLYTSDTTVDHYTGSAEGGFGIHLLAKNSAREPELVPAAIVLGNPIHFKPLYHPALSTGIEEWWNKPIPGAENTITQKSSLGLRTFFKLNAAGVTQQPLNRSGVVAVPLAKNKTLGSNARVRMVHVLRRAMLGVVAAHKR
jgi:hypothetical protein